MGDRALWQVDVDWTKSMMKTLEGGFAAQVRIIKTDGRLIGRKILMAFRPLFHDHHIEYLSPTPPYSPSSPSSSSSSTTHSRAPIIVGHFAGSIILTAVHQAAYPLQA